MFSCSPLLGDYFWDGISKDVVDVPIALFDGHFLSPEFSNATNEFLLRRGLDSSF